jgi:GH35 family endo-1,4-beta-xylanase
MQRKFAIISCLSCALIFAWTHAAHAQQNLIDQTTWQTLQYSGTDKSIASLQWVDVEHPAFTQAAQLTSKKAMRFSYNIQYHIDIDKPVAKGDVLVLSGYVRLIDTKAESGEGLVQIQFQRNTAPYDKPLLTRLPLTKEWQAINIPFISTDSYEAGKTNFCLCIGDYVQTIQAGGFTLKNMGKSVDINTLPNTDKDRLGNYDGRAADAPWRKVAAQNIERLRKGDLAITITDTSGKPIPNATVDVQMTRHAFRFGTAVHSSIFDPNAKFWTEHPQDKARMLQTVKDNFNFVTHETNFKWPTWIQPARRKAADQLVDWLMTNHIGLRGHVMVWPGWSHSQYRHTPDHIVELAKDPANRDKVAQLVLDHITEIGTTYGDKVTTWDVINEPTLHHDLTDYLGGDRVFIDWFKAARKAAPNARLVLNETTGGTVISDRYYYKTIKMLVDAKAPIDAVGFQSHFGQTAAGIPEQLALFDKYAALGLKVDITEFDLDGFDAQYQADYTRDFMTACFGHPAVDTFIVWGIWSEKHWKPSRAMYDKNWNLKPNGKAWMDLVKKQWWTTTSGKTNTQGQYQFRGFKGDYQITVNTTDGKTLTTTTTLTCDGQTLNVNLP